MYNKFLALFFSCFLTLVAFAQETKMSSSEISKFKSELNKLAKTQTLEADFVQYKKVSYVKKEMVSSGKFYVKNPDKLAWIYTSPMQYSMIFRDKKIFIDNKGKKRNLDVSRNKQFEKISQAIQSNTSSANSQNNDFLTTYFSNTDSYIMKLSPNKKDLSKTFKDISLYFDKKSLKLNELKMVEGNNGYTRFVLSNQKINQSLSDDVFNINK